MNLTFLLFFVPLHPEIDCSIFNVDQDPPPVRLRLFSFSAKWKTKKITFKLNVFKYFKNNHNNITNIKNAFSSLELGAILDVIRISF